MGRILITGGSGLIGRALVESLAGGEHEPIVLSRQPDAATPLPRGARAVAWDGKTADGWRELAEGAHAIVHLAGESVAGRWTPAKKRAIRDSRIDSTTAVVQAVRAAAVPPRVVVQASAAGYYGDAGDRPVHEGDPSGADFLAGICREWEQAGEPLEALGVRRPLLRSGIVLSADGGALPQLALPFKLFLGGKLGSGQQFMSFIHIADEIAAIRWLIDRDDLSGPFNLTAPHPVRNVDLARSLGRALGRPSLFRVPRLLLHLVLGEAAQAVLASCRALPQRLAQSGFRFRFPEIDAALADLLRRGRRAADQ